MNGRTTQRYSLRFPDTLVPTVEVTVAEFRPGKHATFEHVVVAKRHGFTRAHAFNRALAWTRAHGDPR